MQQIYTGTVPLRVGRLYTGKVKTFIVCSKGKAIGCLVASAQNFFLFAAAEVPEVHLVFRLRIGSVVGRAYMRANQLVAVF